MLSALRILVFFTVLPMEPLTRPDQVACGNSCVPPLQRSRRRLHDLRTQTVEDQLRLLKEHGYQTVPRRAVLVRLEELAVLAAGDGHRSVYDVLLPIARKTLSECNRLTVCAIERTIATSFALQVPQASDSALERLHVRRHLRRRPLNLEPTSLYARQPGWLLGLRKRVHEDLSRVSNRVHTTGHVPSESQRIEYR